MPANDTYPEPDEYTLFNTIHPAVQIQSNKQHNMFSSAQLTFNI